MGAVNVGCGGEGLSNIGKKDIQAQTSLSMSKMLLITNPAAESAAYPQNKVSAEYGNTQGDNGEVAYLKVTITFMAQSVHDVPSVNSNIIYSMTSAVCDTPGVNSDSKLNCM